MTSRSDDQPTAKTELTEELIAAAMVKAEGRVCVGSDRCYALPSDVETARARCTADGRCRVGLIVSRGGRESWDVWLEIATGCGTSPNTEPRRRGWTGDAVSLERRG